MMGCNDWKIKKFTDFLYEFFVKQNYGLKECFEVMKNCSVKYLAGVSKELLQALENGELLSNAMFTSKCMAFEPTYIAFFRFAEKSGDLKSVLEYLKVRYERKIKNRQKIVSSLMYPVFVIIFALIICILLCIYGKKIVNATVLDFEKLKSTLWKCIFGLCVFSVLIFVFLKQKLGEDRLYEAFLVIAFLVRNGFSLNMAIDYGKLVAGPDSSYGKKFSEAKKRLEYGIEIKNAFSFKNQEIKETLFFAQKSGNEWEIFEKICRRLEEKKEKQRILIIGLLEPLFVGVTGVFLFILLFNFFLPMITDLQLLF